MRQSRLYLVSISQSSAAGCMRWQPFWPGGASAEVPLLQGLCKQHQGPSWALLATPLFPPIHHNLHSLLHSEACHLAWLLLAHAPTGLFAYSLIHTFTDPFVHAWYRLIGQGMTARTAYGHGMQYTASLLCTFSHIQHAALLTVCISHGNCFTPNLLPVKQDLEH